MANDGFSGWQQFVISPQVRATVLLVAGLGLTIREAFTSGVDRPGQYVLWGGMMGLSALQRGSGSKHGHDRDREDD